MWTITLSIYFIYVKDYRLSISRGNNILKLYEINSLASFFLKDFLRFSFSLRIYIRETSYITITTL